MRLRRLNRRQAEDLRQHLADLYLESCLAMTDPADPSAEGRADRDDFLRRLAASARQPGFVLLTAETTVLAGCAFGYPVRPDANWWLGFEGPLADRITRLTAAGRILAVTHVMAHPHAQDHGLPQRLQEQLLAARQSLLGVTLVSSTDRTTHAAFHSWGWEDIGALWRPPSRTEKRVLVIPPDGGSGTPRSPRRRSAAVHRWASAEGA
ncbi:hypothetical protein [Streptomyces sp. cg36]|uniref:hypothetical protein n=1 Tax=Streptomyces sp. cg36 TaxID=3238798 RepID=UPI0034E1DEB9